MRKTLIISFQFTLISFSLFGQQYKWQSIVPGIDCINSTSPSCYITDMLFDSATNQLYVCGRFDSVNHQRVYGLARWNGTGWNDMYGIVISGTRMHRYGNKVIVTDHGAVYYIDSTGVTIIGQADDGIYALETYHGELYVGGDFSKINNQKFNHIARWDGVQPRLRSRDIFSLLSDKSRKRVS